VFAKLTLLILLVAGFTGCVSNYAIGNRCASAPPAAPATASLADGLGVNIDFIDPRPGEMKMLAAAGFRWVRTDLKWDATERERGRYDFTEYDRLMAALEANRIRALFILDYGNPLYEDGAPPRTEEARQAFARWAVAAARHFANRGVTWETYNEPNHDTFWPPRPDAGEYVALALAVGRAFRTAVPNEKLIGPATSEMDFLFLEACFKAGLLEYWSAVSVHPYLRSDPEDVAGDYCRLRTLIAAYAPRGKQVAIISSEWGYSSTWRGLTEEKQAELFVRQMLTNAANGIPLSIWYDWHDDGLNPKEPEHHFGLVNHAYNPAEKDVYRPKPGYQAAKTLGQFFAGYRFERRIAAGGDDDYVLAFSKGVEVRIAAWTTSSRHRVTITGFDGRFSLTGINGQDAGRLATTRNELVVDLSTTPLYLAKSN